MLAFIATLLLPYFGTDFGKGSVRWYSLGFSSVQPSEFLKPGFVVVTAWLMAASQEINGPPGKMWSFLLAVTVAILLVLQPDFGQAHPRPPCESNIHPFKTKSEPQKETLVNAKR